MEKTFIREGKTKIIWSTDEDGIVVIESKDQITAGDGARRDTIAKKAAYSTRTNTNVFELLKPCKVPCAFMEEISETEFRAESCAMIQLEVVVRRESHGSHNKRKPWLQKGHVFSQLVVEFFLKTTDGKWGEVSLPKDDPLMIRNRGRAELYLPDVPIWQQQTPFLVLGEFPMSQFPEVFLEMEKIARKSFLILEKAWQILGRRLVDFKVEFGLNQKGELKLADVIDNDSWRLLDISGAYMDKQVYRDQTATLEQVSNKYQVVAALTDRFGLPRQQLAFWRASQSDNIEPFFKALNDLGLANLVDTEVITCSAHKEPAKAYQEACRLAHQAPDSVIIAYVGKSNGLGPVLAANVTVPVITVPVSEKDVWSSLNMPSSVPLMTMLDPKNAVLAALQILAMRNPGIWSALRMRQEERHLNVNEL